MKKIIVFFFFLLLYPAVFATHITGGEMIYQYMGPGSSSNTSRYQITLRLFRDEAANTSNPPGAGMPPYVWITVFNNDNGSGQNFVVSRNSMGTVPVAPFPPCMTKVPSLDYTVGYFTFTVDLPANQNGYTGAYNTCCRVHPMVNVDYPGNQGTGSTYICRIPGLTSLPTGHNSSPQFDMSVSAVCFKKSFTYSFHATDPDGDSLVYSFTDAYDRGNAVSSADANPPPPNSSPPYYQRVPYINGFFGSQPLGNTVTINPNTGIVSGIAPPQLLGNNPEKYVAAVLVREYRLGVLIAEHRKDFIMNVSDCDLASADLETSYTNCNDFNFNFVSKSPSPNILTYYWDFGDGNTSTLQNPPHTYLAAGVYTLKHVVNRGLTCSDSMTSEVKVFPGFNPDFSVAGHCINTDIQFTDITIAAFGIVDKWSWNFGDFGSSSNTSILKNPTHRYNNPNGYDVQFIVSTSVGCIDTVLKRIDILTNPPLTVTNDTLICYIDTLQLNAVGIGTFTWTPNYMISNTGIADPLVSPDVTTTYRVTLTDPFGCVGTDSVKVDVKLLVSLSAANDSTICQGDPTILKISSDALHYLWTEIPAGNTLNDPTLKNPTATPFNPTTYNVLANIGKCTAQEDITLTTVPYPLANAGADQLICLGNSTQLHASGGSIYSWSPVAFLNAANIPNPVVTNPTDNVRYIVTVRDVLGCPKPVKDTMILTVAKIVADAGPRDTSVVLGQPLQLGATGSTNYSWTPSTWLNDPSIKNPVSTPQNNIEYVVRVSNSAGCFDTDSILVKVYKLAPGFYVPSAFSPNHDNINDIFRPVAIGMKSVDIFRVYNRWGQMLYSGSGNNIGWDGTFGGKAQDAFTYVWHAEGVDYLNNRIRQKGYVVLIR